MKTKILSVVVMLLCIIVAFGACSDKTEKAIADRPAEEPPASESAYSIADTTTEITDYDTIDIDAEYDELEEYSLASEAFLEEFRAWMKRFNENPNDPTLAGDFAIVEEKIEEMKKLRESILSNTGVDDINALLEMFSNAYESSFEE